MAGAVECLVAALERRGLRAYPTSTGGGCEALVVHDADGGEDGYHLLVTNGNLGLPLTGYSGEVLASVYVDAEDEGTLVLDMPDRAFRKDWGALADLLAREV